MINFKDEFILRKFNSILILIIILLLLWHGLISALCMMGIVSYSPSLIETGRRLFLFVSLHIIVSLYLYIRDAYKRKRIRTYFDIQKDTEIQMITGIWIIIFMFLHYISYAMLPVGANPSFNISVIHFVVDNLLFVFLFLHLRVSIPRLLVSFGFLDNDCAYVKAKNNTKKILSILLLFFLISELIFYIL